MQFHPRAISSRRSLSTPFLIAAATALLLATSTFASEGSSVLPRRGAISSLTSENAALDPHGSAAVQLPFASIDEAAAACQEFAREIGGTVMITSGTPSMEPLIHGRAHVVVKKQPFGAIRKSDMLVYMGRLDRRSEQRTCTLHRAVDSDRHGWIMSGDNNRWTESWDRVTPENYVGTVVMIFEVAPENMKHRQVSAVDHSGSLGQVRTGSTSKLPI